MFLMDKLSNTNFHDQREVTDQKSPPSFLEFLQEEEEEEEAPLLDGPVTAPFAMYTPPLGASKAALRSLPLPLVKVVEQIVEPMRAVSEKGITKIEVVIKSEVLSEITVKIDHYDTASHCFNIQLCGSEQAQALFSKYQAALVQSLQHALPAFQITLLPSGFPLVKTRRLSYGAIKFRKKSDE